MIDPAWLTRHVRLLCASYRFWTGRDLIPPGFDEAQAVAALNAAEFAVVSHGTQPDPIFNYANATALRLFEMTWDAFVALPSRLSAETMLQAERDDLLERVTRDGYIDDYTGVRISKNGNRFHISKATVWNLLDEAGQPYGQAALLKEWRKLE